MQDPKIITFILANLIMTVSLVWGLRTIIDTVRSKGDDGRSILDEAMSEKSMPPAGDGDANTKPGSVGSFSRLAGSFGTMALATAVIGVAYWLVYALFYEKSLSVLSETGWFFLSGSALFAPYAFNQLSSIFKLS